MNGYSAEQASQYPPQAQLRRLCMQTWYVTPRKRSDHTESYDPRQRMQLGGSEKVTGAGRAERANNLE